MRRPLRGEGIAVHAHARAGGEFGAHPGVVQGDGVVARLGALAAVVEARGVAAARPGDVATLVLHLAAERHQQHVAQVGVAGAGEVGMREADDGGVVMPVAGGPAIAVPARPDLRVGAELDHAVRHRRARIGVALATSADERVDRRQCALAGTLAGHRRACQQHQRDHPLRLSDCHCPSPWIDPIPIEDNIRRHRGNGAAPQNEKAPRCGAFSSVPRRGRRPVSRCRGSCAAARNGWGGAACAAPWPRSGGCARG